MDDLEKLDPDSKENIRQSIIKLFVDNQKHTNEANHKIVRQFCRLYKLNSRQANDNHDTL